MTLQMCHIKAIETPIKVQIKWRETTLSSEVLKLSYLYLSGVVGIVQERCFSFDGRVWARFQTLLEIFFVACQLINKNTSVNMTDSETAAQYQGICSTTGTFGPVDSN